MLKRTQGDADTSTMENDRRWIEYLSEEDLSFLKRFLLSSGTLKELAKQYGISYPTIRLRLDRIIEKVKLLDQQEVAGPFELRLRSLYADGRLDDETFRALLEAHRAEEGSDERSERDGGRRAGRAVGGPRASRIGG